MIALVLGFSALAGLIPEHDPATRRRKPPADDTPGLISTLPHTVLAVQLAEEMPLSCPLISALYSG